MNQPSSPQCMRLAFVGTGMWSMLTAQTFRLDGGLFTSRVARKLPVATHVWKSLGTAKSSMQTMVADDPSTDSQLP